MHINHLVTSVNLTFNNGLWVVRVPEFLKEEKFLSMEKALQWVNNHLIPPYYEEETKGFISPLDSSEKEEWEYVFPLATEEIPF